MGVTTGKIYDDEIQEKADEPTTFVKGNSLMAVKIKAFFIMAWAAIKSILRSISKQVQILLVLFRFVRAPKKMARGFRRLTPAIEQSCRELDKFATVYQNIKEEQVTDAIIAVDFDGTLCEDKWPKIGTMNDELILWLVWRQRHGAYIILWTCREGEKLD